MNTQVWRIRLMTSLPLVRGRGADADRGAAAVEFALVMPLLFLLLFGIIDYGLWFNDSLSLRQGVRESARQAVVRRASSTCPGTGMAAVACGTRAQAGGGTAYAKVFAPNGWVRGEKVVVCAMVKTTSITGFVPLPSGGLIKSQTSMSIENVTPMPTDLSYVDVPPSGGDWTWCT